MTYKANRRRFIAGAVCPRCSALDKIVVDLDTDHRECVSCGFTQGRPGQDTAQSAGSTADILTDQQTRELPTRVSRASARRMETPAVAITLIDPAEDGAGGGA